MKKNFCAHITNMPTNMYITLKNLNVKSLGFKFHPINNQFYTIIYLYVVIYIYIKNYYNYFIIG